MSPAHHETQGKGLKSAEPESARKEEEHQPISNMIPPDSDSPLEQGLLRPTPLRKSHSDLIMGRKNSFLRTCLLPMAASMEPRFDDCAHHHQYHNSDYDYRDDNDDVDDLNYCEYEEEDSDEEFGWKAKPSRKRVVLNRKSLSRSNTNNSLDAPPPHDLATRMFLCVLGATFASIMLLRNESHTAAVTKGPAGGHSDFDLVDPTLADTITTLDDECGPRAYKYNAGILQWEQVGEDLEHMAIPNADESGHIRYYAVALSWDGRPIDPADPPNYWQPAFMRDDDYYIPQSPTPSPVSRPTSTLAQNPTAATVAHPPAIVAPQEESPTPAPVPASPFADLIPQKSPSPAAAPVSHRHVGVVHGESPTASHFAHHHHHHPDEVPTFSSYEAIPTSHVYEWDDKDEWGDWDESTKNAAE